MMVLFPSMCGLNSSANEFRDSRLILKLSLHSSGTIVWLPKLSHQALVRPGLIQNLRGLAGFFFKRFKTNFCDVETESIFIIFIRFLIYSLWTFNILTCSWMRDIILEISPSKIYTLLICHLENIQQPDWTRFVIFLENLRFHPSTRKREIGVFENLRFHSPKMPFTCGRNAKTDEKTSVLKNIGIRVDGASLSESILEVQNIATPLITLYLDKTICEYLWELVITI